MIRPAVPGDLPRLHALIEGAYRGETARAGWTHEADLLDGQRTDLAALTELLANPGQRLLIAERARELIGCVAVTLADPAYLGLLTVASAAAAMEMTVIRQRDELIRYYERRGYALTGERRPFPHGDARFGLPRSAALEFAVLAKPL